MTASRSEAAACAPVITSGGPGVAVVDICQGDDEVGGVDIAADGQVVIVGTTTGGKGEAAKLVVARLSASGKPDTSFGHDGVVVDDKVGDGIKPSGVMITGEGHVVVIGTVLKPDAKTRAFVAVKYTGEGQRDDTFGQGGMVNSRLSAPGDDSSSGGTLRPDEAVVIGGTTRAAPTSAQEFTAVRYEADGRPDHGFGTGGSCFDTGRRR